MARSKQTASRGTGAARPVPGGAKQAAAKSKPKSKAAGRVAAVAGATSAVKKPHRFKSGTVAGREIKKLQKRVAPIFRYAPLRRLINATVADLTSKAPDVLIGNKNMLKGKEWRLSRGAVEAIQSLIESQLVVTFDKSNVLSRYAGRITVHHGDVWWAKRLESGINSHVEAVLPVPAPNGLGDIV